MEEVLFLVEEVQELEISARWPGEDDELPNITLVLIARAQVRGMKRK